MPQKETMYDLPLAGFQKAFLRSLGQRLEPKLKIGKAGLGQGFHTHLQQLLRANELVKVRFLDADRDERTALCAAIADEGRCLWVGAVGHTALFYRQHPNPAERTVALPEAPRQGGS